jgi:hypothetical protein
VDKNLWAQQYIIATKDAAKPFPINQPTPVLKWRYVTKEESMVPLASMFIIPFYLPPFFNGLFVS